MKKLFTIFVILLSFSFQKTFALSGGPDAYGYTWKDSNEPGGPVYHWYDVIALGGSEVKLLNDDNTRGPFQMNFNFRYYWYDVNHFWVGSNGYMMFGNGQISHPFPNIPNTTLPNDFLAPFMSDLNFGGVGNPGLCYYWISPTTDTLVLSWIGVPFYDQVPPYYQGSNSFQIVLNKLDTTITFQYKLQNGIYNPSLLQFLSIGIENNSGVLGLQNYYDQYPPANYAIRYYYPQNSTYQVNDASVNWNNNTETGGLFLTKGGSPFTMTAQIKNTGNQALGSFNVNGKVQNFNNVVQVQSNVMAGSMAPSDTQNITFLSTYNPVNAGKFKFVSTTQLPGDAFIGNDSKIQELIVIDTAVQQMRLSFDNGLDAGLGGISWTGGGGGCGMYFIPPFYPCKVTKLHYYIVANPQLSSLNAKIYDDDGIGGLAYTMLDSVYLNQANILTASWNTVAVDTPYPVIYNGGFYVAWEMVGDGIALGQDNIAPFSNRTFEVLGQSWAIYRFRETQDLMINATIEHAPALPSGTDAIQADSFSLNLFPNPSSDNCSVMIHSYKSIPVMIEIFDLSGKMVSKKSIESLNIGTTAFKINTASMDAGIYMIKAFTDERMATQKLVIVH